MTCLSHPQGSCTTTRRPTTVPSTWRASATCSPPCPCSWSRWLSAGRPGTNWLRTGKKTAARPTAASAPTACGTASCRKRQPRKAACATRRVFNLWPLRQDGTVGSWFPWEPVEETEAPTHLRGRRCDFDETKSAKAKYCWTLFFLTKQLYVVFFFPPRKLGDFCSTVHTQNKFKYANHVTKKWSCTVQRMRPTLSDFPALNLFVRKPSPLPRARSWLGCMTFWTSEPQLARWLRCWGTAELQESSI